MRTPAKFPPPRRGWTAADVGWRFAVLVLAAGRIAPVTVLVAAIAAVIGLGAASAWATEPDSPEGLGAVELHNLNYALIGSIDDAEHPDGRKSEEAKFQISFKMKLSEIWIAGLYFGYTQKSFWQVYDKRNSRPFRETNYNPEFFLDFPPHPVRNLELGLRVGLFEHESNGQRDPFSRSVNRLYATGTAKRGEMLAALKLWESYEESDNPDIDEFMGHYEVSLDYPSLTRADRIGRNLGFLLKFRKIENPERFTWEGNLFFKFAGIWGWLGINQGLFLHAQVFSGYGESLADFNQRVNRIGLGFRFR